MLVGCKGSTFASLRTHHSTDPTRTQNALLYTGLA
jgi:hypothetical protein